MTGWQGRGAAIETRVESSRSSSGNPSRRSQRKLKPKKGLECRNGRLHGPDVNHRHLNERANCILENKQNSNTRSSKATAHIPSSKLFTAINTSNKKSRAAPTVENSNTRERPLSTRGRQHLFEDLSQPQFSQFSQWQPGAEFSGISATPLSKQGQMAMRVSPRMLVFEPGHDTNKRMMSRAVTPSGQARSHKWNIKKAYGGLKRLAKQPKESPRPPQFDSDEPVPPLNLRMQHQVILQPKQNLGLGLRHQKVYRIEVSTMLDKFLKHAAAPHYADVRYRNAKDSNKTDRRGVLPAQDSNHSPMPISTSVSMQRQSDRRNVQDSRLAAPSSTHDVQQGKDKRPIRKRYEECLENGSTSTNKSSLFAGRVNVSDVKNDSNSSNDRLTVIENDCDNDYSLLFNSLQAQF